ncbi:lanthionine synthetase LanC family protein [Kitasatospora sp. NPDC098663]|uniref:lanthionine synthetase LanC family protein n=1 Tax=Kitasatospora sp. NPDC098663 TaxID=3364096 RepID=UPI00380D640D
MSKACTRWCGGTAGLTHAQQLAAIALGDTRLRQDAEAAMAAALLDPPSLAATTDLSLCHGYAGLAHIAHRAAADATARNAARLRSAAALLLDTTHPPHTDPDAQARRLLPSAGPAFLEGATSAAPATRWDACLLMGSEAGGPLPASRSHRDLMSERGRRLHLGGGQLTSGEP